ncbi:MULTISPECIES: CvpA family protein [Mesobacillus]|uniref:Membrane protein n=2 Tax=Mesobacillus TaxID=2675231 RepID=A0A0D6ZAV1_9BACI|nr:MULTISPECIES: CvpA family protein [Mesobacillus]KIY22171.1 membrane protein [Mesobacillus subterraneus]MDQ0412940.1 putative membrane protein required for colicin V production [Mesobacillus stamsii]
MLDLAVLAILVMGFMVGLKRGFILQTIHLAGFIAAFVVAYVYYEQLAPKLTLWIPYPNLDSNSTFKFLLENTNLEDAYYRAIAFAIIFFAVKILLQIIGSMLDFVAHLPILKQLNVWAGGILGFIEVYLLLFIILYIAALLPIPAIQGPLNDSILAENIIKNTPVFSQQIKQLWIEYKAA